MTLLEQAGGTWRPSLLPSSPNHSGIPPLCQKWESRGGTGSPEPRPSPFHGTVWDVSVITGKLEFLLYRGKYVVVSVLSEAEALCALDSDWMCELSAQFPPSCLWNRKQWCYWPCSWCFVKFGAIQGPALSVRGFSVCLSYVRIEGGSHTLLGKANGRAGFDLFSLPSFEEQWSLDSVLARGKALEQLLSFSSKLSWEQSHTASGLMRSSWGCGWMVPQPLEIEEKGEHTDVVEAHVVFSCVRVIKETRSQLVV